MTALKIAECFELYACDHKPDGWPAIRQGTLNEAAAMLRRQHEAIVELRGAIEESQSLAMWKYTGCGIRNKLEQALADTEEIAK